MRPENALSPRTRLDPTSLKVIYTSPSVPADERRGSWSVAEMVWDGELRVGCRWNGDLDDEEDKGNPGSHRQVTWFILPHEIGRLIAEKWSKRSRST